MSVCPRPYLRNDTTRATTWPVIKFCYNWACIVRFCSDVRTWKAIYFTTSFSCERMLFRTTNHGLTIIIKNKNTRWSRLLLLLLLNYVVAFICSVQCSLSSTSRVFQVVHTKRPSFVCGRRRGVIMLRARYDKEKEKAGKDKRRAARDVSDPHWRN